MAQRRTERRPGSIRQARTVGAHCSGCPGTQDPLQRHAGSKVRWQQVAAAHRLQRKRPARGPDDVGWRASESAEATKSADGALGWEAHLLPPRAVVPAPALPAATTRTPLRFSGVAGQLALPVSAVQYSVEGEAIREIAMSPNTGPTGAV